MKLLLPLLLFCSTTLSGQLYTQFENPSFEGFPSASRQPDSWYNCGKQGETPPDTHPNPIPEESFGVTMPAADGDTYLGMVVRDNETWEAVGQRLKLPLEGGQEYWMWVKLARSEVYMSQSRTTSEPSNYSTPAKLKVWGGDNHCHRLELLAETVPILHRQWRDYELLLTPTNNIEYLTFEVFYQEPKMFPYNGNLLMDDLSPIYSRRTDQRSSDYFEFEKPYEITEIEHPLTPNEKANPNASLDRLFEKMIGAPPDFRKQHEVVHKAFLLYKLQNDMDRSASFRNFCNELSYDDLVVLGGALEEMGLEDLSGTFNKVFHLYTLKKNQEPIGQAAYDFYNAVDPLFAKQYSTAVFNGKRNEFNTIHFNMIGEQLYEIEMQKVNDDD